MRAASAGSAQRARMPKVVHVADLAGAVQDLVGQQADPTGALGVVDHRVEHGFDHPQQQISRDQEYGGPVSDRV